MIPNPDFHDIFLQKFHEAAEAEARRADEMYALATDPEQPDATFRDNTAAAS